MRGNHLLLSFWNGMYLVYLFHKTRNCYKVVLNIKTYCESCLFWSSAVKTEIPWYLSNKNNENYILRYKTDQSNQETIYHTPPPPPKKYSVHSYLSNICDYWSIYLIFHACSAEISCSQHLIKFDWTTYRRILSDSMRKKMLSNERKKTTYIIRLLQIKWHHSHSNILSCFLKDTGYPHKW